MISGRRARRSGRGSAILPLRDRHRQLSHSITCWYCDFKICALNDFLYSFGRKHAWGLRVWFSIGVGFSLALLLGVALILISELAAILHLYDVNFQLNNLYGGFVFGFLPSPLVPGFKIALTDGAYVIFSTLISVLVHEFGHAISAASEGIQIEYIAIFLAVLFPGALVAFNLDLLQHLHQFSSLRIYCAGIWHNAVFCTACALTLFLLPLILYPLYINGENIVVLGVTSDSPLSGYLSPGDIILSLDGLKVRNPQEWVDMMTFINKQAIRNPDSFKEIENSHEVASKKGYCIPSSWVENKKVELGDDKLSCAGELTVFSAVPCFNSSVFDDGSKELSHMKSEESKHCLSARDVAQLRKCGNGWLMTGTKENTCACLEKETCSAPVLKPGHSWVEIMYKRPHSSECLWRGSNSTDYENNEAAATQCDKTIVFVGDVLSMANSVRLTAYKPRWASNVCLHMPNMLERMFACTFHVSLALALLNSLPVFLLDGASILEATLGYFPLVSHRERKRILQICLLGGTILTFLAFSRILLMLL